MIIAITLDKTDALLIKKGLTLLDSHFESIEIMDNRNLKEKRHKIENIISDLNIRFNLI